MIARALTSQSCWAMIPNTGWRRNLETGPDSSGWSRGRWDFRKKSNLKFGMDQREVRFQIEKSKFKSRDGPERGEISKFLCFRQNSFQGDRCDCCGPDPDLEPDVDCWFLEAFPRHLTHPSPQGGININKMVTKCIKCTIFTKLTKLWRLLIFFNLEAMKNGQNWGRKNHWIWLRNE